MLRREEADRVIRSRADRDSFELSYASMNWIRFKGSPCRKMRSLASQPPGGAPLAGWKLLRLTPVSQCGSALDITA